LCKVGGQRGGNTNKQSGQAYEWGRKYGRVAVESGQLAEARKCIDKEKQRESVRKSGKIVGQKAVESGQFKQAQERGWEATRKRHEEKDEEGKSILARSIGKKAHEQKDENGKSVLAVANGKKAGKLPWWNDGEVERRQWDSPGEGFKPGRLEVSQKVREAARKNFLIKWMDPDHPELGTHNAGVLAQKQRKMGLPHGKENRKRVG
jgi:hypothetical protein